MIAQGAGRGTISRTARRARQTYRSRSGADRQAWIAAAIAARERWRRPGRPVRFEAPASPGAAPRPGNGVLSRSGADRQAWYGPDKKVKELHRSYDDRPKLA